MRQLIKRVAPPLMLGAGLAAAGIAALIASETYREAAVQERNLAAERRRASETELARVRTEGTEIEQRVARYLELAARGAIGQERRLEWLDALERLRTAYPEYGLRYTIDRQRSMERGTPIAALYVSQLHLRGTVRHEDDFFWLLGRIQKELATIVMPRSCNLQSMDARRGEGGIGLDLECTMDLITVRDDKKG